MWSTTSGGGGEPSAAGGTALTVEVFDAPAGDEVWNAYERTARSYVCTRAFAEQFDDVPGAVVALVRRADSGEIEAGFRYRLGPDGSAQVLGRYAAPRAEAIAAFAEAVFTRHAAVERIDVDTIDALPDAARIERPVLVVRDGFDLRIPLPDRFELYERSLGKRALDRARYDERHLARDHPTARISTRVRGDVPRSWVAEVVRLNRERMAERRAESVYSPRYEEGIFRVVQAHGFVTVLQEGERVLAGAIDVQCGPEAFGWVIGHDRAYGKYSPGLLCQRVAIRHAIASGVRTFHLLQGDSPFKREVGGTAARLASYVILRSWSALRLADLAALCRRRVERLARWSVEAGDRVAERVVHRPRPLVSLARGFARRPHRGHA